MSNAKEQGLVRKGKNRTGAGSTGSQGGFGSIRRSRASFARVRNLGAILNAVLDSGDAILMARTSDGGAIVLQLLDGGDKPKAYCVDQEQLDDNFAWLYERYGRYLPDASVPEIVENAPPYPNARVEAVEHVERAHKAPNVDWEQLELPEQAHTTLLVDKP